MVAGPMSIERVSLDVETGALQQDGVLVSMTIAERGYADNDDDVIIKETLLALVRDLFTFSNKVIQMFIIV
jgi:hypothetical protein